jgi:hypothetical protein
MLLGNLKGGDYVGSRCESDIKMDLQEIDIEGIK